MKNRNCPIRAEPVHYSGSVTYHQEISTALDDGRRLFVRVPAYGSVAVRVLVGGRVAGIAAWDPNEVEITDLVRQAATDHVELQLQVLGHRRNSHGPLHYCVEFPTMTGPWHFVTQDTDWTDGYQSVPMGLLAPPSLVVKE